MGRLLQQLVGDHPAMVAFDLDGTLVDSVPDIALAVDKMRQDMGMPPAGEQAVRHWVGNGAELLVKRALADSLETEAVAAITPQQMAQAFPIFKQHYQQTNGQTTQLYPGVLDCLQGLKDLKVSMAVVTNKPKVFTDPLLGALGIDHFFVRVIGGDCLPEKKPSPLALNHLAREFDCAPTASLMVGDSKHDVGAGRAAGYKVLCVSYGYNHGEPISASQPDAIVDNLAQLVC